MIKKKNSKKDFGVKYKVLLFLSIVLIAYFSIVFIFFIDNEYIDKPVDRTYGVKSFTRFEVKEANAVFTGGGPDAWDEHIREKVWIIEDNGLFRMWYTGHRGPRLINQRSSKIGYAFSIDGINWIRYENNPIIDRPSQDQDMSVVKVSDTSYHMYVERDDNYIDLFLSRDGINWTFHSNVKTDATSPVVWKNESEWFMLYENMMGFSYDIHLATSKDGKIWTDSPYNPVLEENRHTVPNSIIYYEGTYHLYYHKATDTWSLWHATSQDLINWDNRQMISSEFSGAFTFIDSQGQIRSYMWYLDGSRNYYLKFGIDIPEYKPKYNKWNPVNYLIEGFIWYVWRRILLLFDFLS